MASHGEWCEEKLSQLINEEQRLPVLQEMKDVLTSIPKNEASRTASSLRLPLIFDCLNDTNTEQVDLACDVLTLCMANLNLGESTNKYGVFLERALNHPFPAVKFMALNEIKRNIENDDILVGLCKRTSLIGNIIKCLGDEDLGVAKRASDIVVIIGLSSVGIKQIISNEALKEIHEIMSISEIVRLRLYEVLIKISVQSKDNLNTLIPTGLLNQILEELKNDADVLLKLNILEVLTVLGECKHGYDFLESNETFKKISQMLETDDPIYLGLCEPGILKFFGRIAHWSPFELLSKYPIILKRLYNNLETNDFTLMGVSLDTIGYIGLSNNGKIALDSSEYSCENMIKTIAKLLPSLPTETKVRGLNCLENLLRVTDSDSRVTTLTAKWFRFIDNEDPMDFLWRFAKNPFADLRLAGFGIFNAIASQVWGQEDIKNTPGLLEFLLDRNIETTKDCKEAKYGIIELLALSQIFDQSDASKLLAYVRDGPFYVQTITEVATENID